MNSISDIAASAGARFIEAIKAPFKLIGRCFGKLVQVTSSVINYLSGRSVNAEQSQAASKTLSSRTVATNTDLTGTDSTGKISTEKLEEGVPDNVKTAFEYCLELYLNLMEELDKKVYQIHTARFVISSRLDIDPEKITRNSIDRAITLLKNVNKTLDLGFSDKFFVIPPDSPSNNAEFINILTTFQQQLESLLPTNRPDKYSHFNSHYPVRLLQQEIDQLTETNCADKDKWQRCGERLKEQFAFDEPYIRELCALKYVPEPDERAPEADSGQFIYLEARLSDLFDTIDNL
ncbi:hypothetical protein J7438_17770 [Thalassotalea sp. G20_0]|uniref:hypothetical protein n=1 Tax=Thalassotalea sp. G20_0 TaxID=2821093 RepID=UPI001ADD1304|nr:hypothetical protein [Thalassotalea sp. G20_0]MBO9495916.1 hypothetical protein [Thalassotalea sp. G20_0]